MYKTIRWHDPGCNNVAAELTNTVTRIVEQHQARREEDAQFLKIYNHKDMLGTGRSDRGADPWKRLRYNLFRTTVTTCRSNLGAMRPAVRVNTTNADWPIMRKAKAIEAVVRAVFDDNDIYELFKEIFTDALVTPIGAIKVFSDGGVIKLERVLPGAILVDRDEGYHRKPANLYQIDVISRDRLYRDFPDKTDVIDSAAIGNASDAFSWLPGWDLGDDQVLVIESWHLPYTDRKTDKPTGGKHALCCTSGELIENEEYNAAGFPFAFYRWEKRTIGWPGASLCEEIRPQHETIAYLDAREQDALYNASRTKIFVQKGTNIDNLTDDPRDVIEVDGPVPIQVFVPNVIPPEIRELRSETIQDAIRQIGMNEMTMTGTRPPGDWSGIALQELKDSSSQRFKDKQQEIEQFYLDLSKVIIRVIEQAADSGELKAFRPKPARNARYQVNEIDWTKQRLDDSEYWLETNASSSLPQSTAGRMATIQIWQQMGWIDNQQARELMDLPDLESANSIALAPYYEALDKIEDIVEQGVYTMPESTDDLESTMRLALGAYNKFKRINLEPEKLQMLLRLIDDCQALLEEAQAPAAMPAPVGMPAPAPGQGLQAAAPPGMPPLAVAA